jgi:hypothetical protein
MGDRVVGQILERGEKAGLKGVLVQQVQRKLRGNGVDHHRLTKQVAPGGPQELIESGQLSRIAAGSAVADHDGGPDHYIRQSARSHPPLGVALGRSVGTRVHAVCGVECLDNRSIDVTAAKSGRQIDKSAHVQAFGRFEHFGGEEHVPGVQICDVPVAQAAGTVNNLAD